MKTDRKKSNERLLLAALYAVGFFLGATAIERSYCLPNLPYSHWSTEWQMLAPLLPAARLGGRPEVSPKREIVNTISPVLRTGSAWQFVPSNLLPWGIVVCHYF
jgi:putative transposase